MENKGLDDYNEVDWRLWLTKAQRKGREVEDEKVCETIPRKSDLKRWLMALVVHSFLVVELHTAVVASLSGLAGARLCGRATAAEECPTGMLVGVVAPWQTVPSVSPAAPGKRGASDARGGGE